MIFFKKIRYKNFMATGNDFLEINLNSHQTSLVIGVNGAGKTTIIDAISFVLFNKPFRNIKKNQLVNSITKKDCLVEIEFSIGSKEYLVRRGIRPNVFEIFVDEKLVEQDAASKDYQENLEKNILRTNHKSFFQIVILGPRHVPFMSLAPGQRREIVEDLLDLQVFSRMNVIAKNKYSELSLEKKALRAEHEKKKEKLKILLSYEESLASKDFEMIEIKKKSIEEALVKLEDLRNTYDEFSSIVSSFKPPDTASIKKSIREVLSVEAALKNKKIVASSDLEFFETNDVCSTCRQPISPDHKHGIISKRNSELIETSEGIIDAKKVLEDLEKQLDAIEKETLEIERTKTHQRSILNGIKAQKDYVSLLEKEIEKLSEKKTNNEHAAEIPSLKESLKSDVEVLNKIEEELSVMEASLRLLKDDGIKSMIVKTYVPIINKYVSKYLAALDFFVEFYLDENFSETIRSRYRDEFTYDSFSEGEKFRINIALLFTWRAVASMRNSMSTNLLFLDEIMDGSLDSDGVEEFLKLLHKLTGDNNVFVISHRTDQIIDKFQNVIKMNKVRNFTTFDN